MVDDAATIDLGIAGLGPAVRIGSGGFADVFRAPQINLRREVAVKVLRAPADDAQARMRFERECHALGAVSGHPNIVGVHEGGFTPDGRAYLIMEFFPGGSLRDRLDRDGPLPPSEVADVGRKIGRALGVAHEAGVVHRDVKPANILVSAWGEPALADFGIARVDGGQQTATGLVTASFIHAAPEVLEGASPSPSSDLYSLGSTLFELFTGVAPHFRPDDESVWALMNRVVSEPVPDPATVGMPEPLASTVRRATARRPADRFSRASDFVTALSAGGGPAPSSHPVTVPSPPPSKPPADRWSTPQLAAEPTVYMTPSEPSTPLLAFGQPTLVQPPGDVPLARRGPAGPGSSLAGPGPYPSPGAHPAPSPPFDDRLASSPSPRMPDTATPAPWRTGRSPAAILAATVAAVVVVVGLGVAARLILPSGSDELDRPVLGLAAADIGPLQAGSSYQISVTGPGVDGSAGFQTLVDGTPVGPLTIGELEPFAPPAGRHQLQIQVTRQDEVAVTEPVEFYAIGDAPDAGFRANLASLSIGSENWPAALDAFDRLVAAGHDDLQLLTSDAFPSLRPGFWNLFVPGFGQDRQAAEAYCAEFDLAIPNECFASRFDPEG
ncbi:MAG: protein kinase [Acidimicrobiales bacterium]